MKPSVIAIATGFPFVRSFVRVDSTQGAMMRETALMLRAEQIFDRTVAACARIERRFAARLTVRI
jgi:hypothetical protein